MWSPSGTTTSMADSSGSVERCSRQDPFVLPSRWFAALLVLAGLVAVPISVGAQQEEAPSPPAEQEQRAERLDQRNRLWNESHQLAQQGKLDEALRAADEVYAIEVELLGKNHADTIGTLDWQADLIEQAEDFDKAEKVRQQALHAVTELYGKANYRVTDARIALEDTRRVAQLSPEERARLAEADRATRELMERFYDNLWNKEMGKLAALREAQLWMLRERGPRGLELLDEDAGKSSHRLPPYYWAGFVLSGDWR